MEKQTPTTPLLALLQACDDKQRTQIATWAGTSVSYMYALASCSRKSCRSKLAAGIEDASKKMNRTTNGKTPIVTMRELATMCSLPVITAKKA